VLDIFEYVGVLAYADELKLYMRGSLNRLHSTGLVSYMLGSASASRFPVGRNW
jgi:hypothetical protein